MSLTFQDIEREVRRVAAEEPDTTATHYYFDSYGVPKCIFGVVMSNLGYVDELRDAVDIHAVENGDDCGPPIVEFVLSLEDFDGELDGDHEYWLENVQLGNDLGKTWKDAVLSADTAFDFKGW